MGLVRRPFCWLPLLGLVASCAGAGASAPPPGTVRLLSIVATADLHGHVENLPIFAGHLTNLRRARRGDGAVLLVDAGDLFQGTIASNLAEGAPVVRAYNALGYAAVAVGNHEFDYGPVGSAASPASPADDPRGALKARLAEASFPFLSANLVRADGSPPGWPNLGRSTTVEVAGVRVGVVGASTESTPRTTLAENFVGLRVTPLAQAVVAEARALRAAGADLVLLLMHAGGSCARAGDPDDLSACKADEEGFAVARALPPGTVDAIFGGHTHQSVAHRVNGVPMLQAWANGRGFARLDLRFDLAARRVVEARILPHRSLCRGKPPKPCRPRDYEGAPVEPDAQVAALLAPDLERAAAVQGRPLGVTLRSKSRRAYREESPLGNLVADMMRAGMPGADVAVTNGGGLRANLPAGPLDYGALYAALPFDNRMATLVVRGGELRRAVAQNLERKSGIVSLSGLRAVASCRAGKLEVELRREDGRAVADDEPLRVVTSDFLATGGDGFFGVGPVEVHEATLRDTVASALSARGGTLEAGRLPSPRRLEYPGTRPVRCP